MPDQHLQINAQPENFALRESFTISRGSRTQAEVITVTIRFGASAGRGEAVPYARYGESIISVLDQIAQITPQITSPDHDLTSLLPAGAARNALDCALWDLRAKLTGQPAAALAGLSPLKPLTTAYTLSLSSPEEMKKSAQKQSFRPILKIKLGGEGDMARLEAVRAGAPSAKLIIDANEGWSADEYAALAPTLKAHNVALVEQPLPAGEDDMLAELPHPVPICADESCHISTDLARLKGLYEMVNIKLDKAGGLTEAIALHQAARKAGFGVMVGCMVGSSLAMAPAILVAQGADYVDLDGPLLLREDRANSLQYQGSTLHPPTANLWG